jgi:hypothetical protein
LQAAWQRAFIIKSSTLIIYIKNNMHDMILLQLPYSCIMSRWWNGNCLPSHQQHFAQTSNMRLNLVARGTDIMAAPRATPKIRCEIENVALSCGFFRGRWGDNGRFATGADRGRLVCRDLLPDGDTLGWTALWGQDV